MQCPLILKKSTSKESAVHFIWKKMYLKKFMLFTFLFFEEVWIRTQFHTNWCGSLALILRSTLVHKKCKTHKNSSEKIYVGQKNHEVHLTVWCSTVFSLKQCGFLSDAVHSSILVSRKIEWPHFGKIKTAPKPQGIRESVLHEKVAPRRYLSNGVSLASFRPAVCKNSWKNGRCHSLSAAPFSKLI